MLSALLRVVSRSGVRLEGFRSWRMRFRKKSWALELDMVGTLIGGFWCAGEDGMFDVSECGLGGEDGPPCRLWRLFACCANKHKMNYGTYKHIRP
jgi:hypothetical protein